MRRVSGVKLFCLGCIACIILTCCLLTDVNTGHSEEEAIFNYSRFILKTRSHFVGLRTNVRQFLCRSLDNCTLLEYVMDGTSSGDYSDGFGCMRSPSDSRTIFNGLRLAFDIGLAHKILDVFAFWT